MLAVRPIKKVTVVTALLFCGVAALVSAPHQPAVLNPQASGDRGKDRARALLTQALPTLDGGHLKIFLVEVNYGPGESSSAHSHPCPVIGYVVEGMLRSQVQGQPEQVYKPGETFYEPPNGVHLVSANASSTQRARLLAYFVCDHETPLSIEVPQGGTKKGTVP